MKTAERVIASRGNVFAHMGPPDAVELDSMARIAATINSARRAGKQPQASLPHAVSARYDRRIGRILIQLSSGIDLAFPPDLAEGLQDATPAQLNAIEISPSGFGIHFPKIDADLYLPAILDGYLGSRNRMASRLGAQGGKSRTPANAMAARKNGRSGGRPRKTAAVA